MPQTIGLLLFQIGAPLVLANFAVSATGAALINIGIAVGTSLAAGAINGALNRTAQPQPENGQAVIRQAIAARRSGYGRQRLGGVYVLYEASDSGASVDIIALHHGEIDAFERYWIGDIEVTVDGGNLVQHAEYFRVGGSPVMAITTKRGLPSETAHALATGQVPTIWTANHRGDGIASLCIVAASVAEDKFAKAYPNGQTITPTVAARLQKPYDPRTETSAWTANSALCLAHYLTSPHGAGLDWDRVIAPAIDLWIAAADICDEAVPLKAGGTQPRYQVHGTYSHDDPPSEVIKALLSTMDGWLWQRPDGSIGIRAGRYEEPTVTITAEHIRSYSLQLGEAIERSVTEIKASYIDQSQDFAAAEADPWVLGDVYARVGRSLPVDVDLSWVGHHAQARRLMKREASRQSAFAQGTITTDLAGLNAIGERYIRIELDELGDPRLASLIVEVTDLSIDLMSGATISWRAADPLIDLWTAASEEGTAPGTLGTYTPAATEPPDDLVGDTVSAGGVIYLSAAFTGDYDGRGQQVRVEWRVADIGGGIPGSWQAATYPAEDDGAGSYTYYVGPVTSGIDYDLRVAIVTASGALTDYTDPVTVTA